MPAGADSTLIDTPYLPADHPSHTGLTGHDLLSNNSDFLSSDAFNKNLNLRRGIAGAGGALLGAGLGLTGGFLYDSIFNNKKPSFARMVKNTLLGGLMGGVGGAGLGAYLGGKVPAYALERRLSNFASDSLEQAKSKLKETAQSAADSLNPAYNALTGRVSFNIK